MLLAQRPRCGKTELSSSEMRNLSGKQLDVTVKAKMLMNRHFLMCHRLVVDFDVSILAISPALMINPAEQKKKRSCETGFSW